MTVVLGSGWPGILLHDVGPWHISTQKFQRVLGPHWRARRLQALTVIDDGTIPDRRGSLNIDDEATPPSATC